MEILDLRLLREVSTSEGVTPFGIAASYHRLASCQIGRWLNH